MGRGWGSFSEVLGEEGRETGRQGSLHSAPRSRARCRLDAGCKQVQGCGEPLGFSLAPQTHWAIAPPAMPRQHAMLQVAEGAGVALGERGRAFGRQLGCCQSDIPHTWLSRTLQRSRFAKNLCMLKAVSPFLCLARKRGTGCLHRAF